jgi:hypothetical protein
MVLSSIKYIVLILKINARWIIRRPTAFLPVAMSLAALAMVLGHVAIYGVVHEADEGTVAHLFQLLIMAQVPIVAVFAIKYLRQAPKETVWVLTLQALAVLTAMAPVLLLNL